MISQGRHGPSVAATRKIIYAALLLLLSAALAELPARILFPEYADRERYLEQAFGRLLNSGVYADRSGEFYSSRFGHMYSPNHERVEVAEEYRYTIRTNSLGFRTRELRPKRPGEYRVLLLGDSMLFGVGVDEPEMVSSCLENLQAGIPAPRRSLSVYNYSVTGYHTVQELIVARTFARQADPDQIVLGFFTANDVIPNALSSISDDGNYLAREERVKALREDLRDRLSVCLGSVLCRALALETYVPRLRYELASRPDILGDSLALLKSLDDLSRELGARFTVVIIHPRDAVEGGLVQAWSRSRRVGRLLADFCAANGIEVVDLLDFMEGVEARRRYFYRRDGHLTREGQAAVARAIFERAVRGQLTAP